MSETRLRGPISFSSGFRGDSFTTAGAGISDRKAVPYPSPFFDIAHTYLPYTIKGLFRYCRYYFLTNPLIFAVASKMSEYPVTDLVYQSEEEELRRRYQRLFEDVLDIKMTQIECGLDLNVYGNCFLSIRYPFIKYLKCQHCGGQFKASESRYRFVGLKFRLSCPACGHDGDAIAKDVYIKSISDIRLVRWNPEYVDVEGNELTKDFSYYLHIPPQTKNDILLGKREVIESIEQPFIEAVRLQKAVKFYGEGIHHLRRPSITWKDSCYGIPLLLPVLKDTFYLQILRKAQEAIVSQHIVPLRILFPQPGTETSDPMRMTKLPTWVGRIEDEIAKWRRDSNYIPVLPLPIGQEMIGGDGKALLLFQEQKILADQIIAGMGVPQEFIYGGLSYAGSSVSMRMLENQFISYRSKMLRILRIVANRIAAYMEWPSIDLDFTPFRMADDLQRTSLHFQLNQANRLSSRTMLEIAGFDYDEEMRQLEEEKKKERGLMEADQLSQATIQGKAQAIAMGFQMKAQQSAEQSAMAAGWAPLGAGPAGGGDPNAMAAGADPYQMGGDPSAMAFGDPSMAAKQATQGGAPDGTTLYPENGQPEMPSDMSSPIGGAATPGIDVNYVAMRVANEISQEPPDQQRKSLNQLQQRFPSLYELVVQLLENSTGSQQDPMDATEMPMPEQRAPRRQGGI